MEGSPKHPPVNPNPPPVVRSSATIASTSAATRPKTQLPHSPTPLTRSEPDNPYPTSFVQADPSTFKQVVQMLTGPSNRPDPPPPPHGKPRPIPPLKTVIPKKPQSGGFRLYERRNSLKKLSLNLLVPFSAQAGGPGLPPNKPPETLSPSVLNFPSLVLSPVTPLMPDPLAPALEMEAEERAIKEKGFFLRPSARGSASSPEPRLLPLFPVTSPRVSGSD